MEELGLDPVDLDNLNLLRPKLQQMLKEDKLEFKLIQDLNDRQLFDKLIETRIESKSAKTTKPCFFMNHPLLMSPLAKSHAQGRQAGTPGAEFLSERFELFINGMEVINAYSEQNNSKLQAQAFTA